MADTVDDSRKTGWDELDSKKGRDGEGRAG